ncbi:MAG: hypothetical protein LQ342_007396 [Letrouitia transgressa]|nr:MAG: hypothetical protein LQ342_007396 [Letrouitia transgressa]
MAQHPLSSFGSRADDRLETILNQYSSVQHVHPLWNFILNFDAARCNLFERSFAHELQRIKRSSQDLEDHEINIYQKAFRILMDQPNTFIGAVHIYIDKILGLSNVGDLHRLYALTPSITFKSKMLACKLPDFLCGIRITWFPLPPHAAQFKAIYPHAAAGDSNYVRNVKLPNPIEDTYDVDRSKTLACKLPKFIRGMRITWFPFPPHAAHSQATFPRRAAGDDNNVRTVKLSYSIDDTYDVGRENGTPKAQLISANTLHTTVHNLNIRQSIEEKDNENGTPKAQLISTNTPRTIVHNPNIRQSIEKKDDENGMRNAQIISASTPRTTVHNLNIHESIEEKDNENGTRNAQLISASTPHTSFHIPNTNESIEEKDISMSDDPKLSQLLETYGIALQEFGAADPDTPRHMATAKFLRDTAENCIHYLETHGGCIMLEKLTEIRACLAEATVAAERGMGGKRRRFEYDYTQVPKGPRQDKERKGAKRPKHSHGRTRAESQRGYYDRYIPN